MRAERLLADLTESLLDAVAVKRFGRTRAEAHAKDECIRCRRVLALYRLSPLDREEYRISATCPECWDELFGEPECE